MLHINTVKVDTTQAIKDIKPPLKAPITFKEILPYLIGAIALALLVLGIIWLIRHFLPKRKNNAAEYTKPLEPAEVIALRDLESLWQKKLCEKGHFKEFYSKLSLITRTYIFIITIDIFYFLSIDCIYSFAINLDNASVCEKLSKDASFT